MQTEICDSASIEVYNPALLSLLVPGNQQGLTLLFTALYAVQVAGGYAGGTDLATLCGEIDAGIVDTLFLASGLEGTGTEAKNFVCGAST